MSENSINTIIVNPRSSRLYNYWVNGTLEKRSMMKERMREFCLELSPDNANEINRCIDEILPFVIFVDQNKFEELEEKTPKPISPADRLFPYRKKVYSKKINLHLESPTSSADAQAKRFSIWEKFNIHLDSVKKNPPKNLFKNRTL